jgi:hypothetical protein
MFFAASGLHLRPAIDSICTRPRRLAAKIGEESGSVRRYTPGSLTILHFAVVLTDIKFYKISKERAVPCHSPHKYGIAHYDRRQTLGGNGRTEEA